MDAKRATSGLRAALAGFVAGYVTALLQRRQKRRPSYVETVEAIRDLIRTGQDEARNAALSEDDADDEAD